MTGHELNGFGHEIQCDEALRWRALKVIPQGAFDNVGTRFLLAGSIAEWNRTVDYPPNFLFERKQVALEVIWYIGVRGPFILLCVLADMDCWARTSPSLSQ